MHFSGIDNIGAEEVTVLSAVFHKRELQIRKSKLSKFSQDGDQFFNWIERPKFPQSQSVSFWNYRVCVCKPPGCSILDMNSWAAISAQHTPCRESHWDFATFFWSNILVFANFALFNSRSSFYICVLKSYLTISLWVSSHYTVYLCFIIFNWHLVLLKFPSLLLCLVCTLGKGEDFSFK